MGHFVAGLTKLTQISIYLSSSIGFFDSYVNKFVQQVMKIYILTNLRTWLRISHHFMIFKTSEMKILCFNEKFGQSNAINERVTIEQIKKWPKNRTFWLNQLKFCMIESQNFHFRAAHSEHYLVKRLLIVTYLLLYKKARD